MYHPFLALALALIFLDAALLVDAGLYVIQPFQGSTCHGGESCTITWIDDGSRPLLSAIGVSTVGLYTGEQKLVQTITPVDVSSRRSITFKPDPAAGPNSDGYYIAITSTKLKGSDGTPYSGFSPYFRLTGMSGSFDRPLPGATSIIPIPSSLTHSTASDTKTSTITISRLSTTSVKPIVTPSKSVTSPSAVPSDSSSTVSTSSLFSISLSASTQTSATVSSTSPASSGSLGSASCLPSPISMFALAFFSLVLISLS